jgi:hypothetical protein
MARDENLPFEVGTTFFGGQNISQTGGANLEGQEYWVEDDDASAGTIGAQPSRSGRKRRLRVVRNMNATAVLRRQVAKLKNDGSTPGVLNGQIDGLCASVADKGYPVDEFLSSEGCKQYDLCYVVVDGLAAVVTDTAGDTNFGIGAWVIPGATTAGRVIEADLTATGAALFNTVKNAIGVAAAAVNGTSLQVIVDVGGHRR